jgi:hypothetical protein
MESHLIKSANTGGGWAIGLLRTIAYGNTVYQVVRMDPQSRYVVISNHDAEADARKAANHEYRLDKAA